MSEQKNKFEAMLEKLVADDKQGAEELFHDIVVEKSREIYENLLEGDLEDAKVEEKTEEKTDAKAKEDKKDEAVEEKTDASEKEEDAVEEKTETSEKEEDAVEEKADDSEKAEDKVEEVSTDEADEKAEETAEIPAEQEISPEAHGGDATDDMIGDIEADKGEEGNDDNGEEDIEDRVVDLEDAIDDLKAEFEKMMNDKEDGEGDDEDSEGDEEKEDEAIATQSAEGEVEVAPELGDQPAVESKEAPKTATEEIREYVNKVSASHTDGSDNSTKSPVAGKNDMGGSSSNIAQGGEESGRPAPKAKDEDAGNVNKPGAKAKMNAAPKAQTKAGDDGSSTKSTLGS
mgnify:CR=1 FL=1|tara:strand:+ start:1033 stop:2064 length:1032 start_codon:yes stop_codon:yes gene_type:complete